MTATVLSGPERPRRWTSAEKCHGHRCASWSSRRLAWVKSDRAHFTACSQNRAWLPDPALLGAQRVTVKVVARGIETRGAVPKIKSMCESPSCRGCQAVTLT